jgi:hypothetical protein
MTNRLIYIGALGMALWFAGSACAQVICSNLSNGTYCDGAGGYSSATPLGGGSSTIIRNSDGSRSTINNLDGGTIILRNSDGSRSTINRLDGSTVIRSSDGSHSTITPLGGGTVIRSSDGSSSTIVPLGNPGYNGGAGNSGFGNSGLGSGLNNGGGSRCVRMGMTTSCD